MFSVIRDKVFTVSKFKVVPRRCAASGFNVNSSTGPLKVVASDEVETKPLLSARGWPLPNTEPASPRHPKLRA